MTTDRDLMIAEAIGEFAKLLGPACLDCANPGITDGWCYFCGGYAREAA